MSALDNESNNQQSVLEEREATVKYKDKEYLTYEEMEILTDKLSKFNKSGGDPYSSINCMYTQYTSQSNINKTDNGYLLKTLTYMKGGELGIRELTISFEDSDNIDPQYGPLFKLKLDSKSVYGITTNLNMVELQMLKCCIDALINATLPLYTEKPNREENLFLPDVEEAYIKKNKSLEELLNKASSKKEDN